MDVNIQGHEQDFIRVDNIKICGGGVEEALQLRIQVTIKSILQSLLHPIPQK